MAGGGDTDPNFSSGVSWFDQSRMVMVLLVVLASALSLPYFRYFNETYPTRHPAFLALAAGLIVAVVTYLPMRVADTKFALSNSILLGLLVAEFSVYGAPKEFPEPMIISFFFFMFYFGHADSGHLWPSSYKG